ncbi:MAG: hypothetical protein D6770_05985 [Anaerolineae bacterium]|nr:MAG: hypothetical protein D6770_05985 [Anaerolineae bacterium]
MVLVVDQKFNLLAKLNFWLHHSSNCQKSPGVTKCTLQEITYPVFRTDAETLAEKRVVLLADDRCNDVGEQSRTEVMVLLEVFSCPLDNLLHRLLSMCLGNAIPKTIPDIIN